VPGFASTGIRRIPTTSMVFVRRGLVLLETSALLDLFSFFSSSLGRWLCTARWWRVTERRRRRRANFLNFPHRAASWEDACRQVEVAVGSLAKQSPSPPPRVSRPTHKPR
jgi:hypothetical protein